ncbi:MAG TPA: hypothetical protein VHG91_07305 [Longimicrobium sp.]|nr:hypothetical protein [Longimicrobium sp.]
MDDVLEWDLLLWVLRGVLLAVTVLAGGVLVLYLARFFRPRHVWRLLKAELPAFRNVQGTAKLLGQELTLQGEFAEKHGEQLRVLDERVRVVEGQLKHLVDVFVYALLPFPRGSDDRDQGHGHRAGDAPAPAGAVGAHQEAAGRV